MRTSIGSA